MRRKSGLILKPAALSAQPIYKLEQWREKADAALDGALKERESYPASGELAAAMQRIGELSMEVELRAPEPRKARIRSALYWRASDPSPLLGALLPHNRQRDRPKRRRSTSGA
jgi:hypothetical protein